MHFAAERGNIKIVQMLLDMPNVYVNAPDKQGKTPFDLAIANNHKDVADLLQSRVGSKDTLKKSKESWNQLFY